jgi:hypothetical protein
VPSIQAEKQIVTVIDFIERGGTLMIRRRHSPRATRSSWCVIARMCQFV